MKNGYLCARYCDNVIIHTILFVLKIKGVDGSDMQNHRLQYNILNKDICKNSKDNVGAFNPEIVLPYTICLLPLIPYS